MGTRRIMAMALAGLITVSLWGCAPKQPKVASQAQAVTESQDEASAGMGSFNLQKRHGLGGWSKPAGPSEADLLRHMAAASPNTRPSAEQPEKGSR